MLWLYWRRVRLVVIVPGTALAAVAVLVVAAGALGGGVPRSGASRTTSPRPPQRRFVVPVADAAAVHRGLLLMTAATAACQDISYHGVQMVAWSGAGGSASYLIEVWHRAGELEPTGDDDDLDDQLGSGHEPGTAAGGGAAAGVLSIAPWMLRLLRANYLIEYTGVGTSSDRPAAIIALRRPDGSLAARYWLDKVTGLPLRRETFDQGGRLVSEGAFIDLQIGDSDVRLVPPAQTRAWSAQPTELGMTTLREHGWPVPNVLAGNLALVGITRTATRSGPVVDAFYSDGLSVVSVFMQRGELPRTLAGWRQATISGLPVFRTDVAGLDERGIAWSARGFVFTVVADASAQTVAHIVDELPHDRDFGLWQRVGRGLRRMASWFNPFD